MAATTATVSGTPGKPTPTPRAGSWTSARAGHRAPPSKDLAQLLRRGPFQTNTPRGAVSAPG